jgi:hypothetical protein
MSSRIDQRINDPDNQQLAGTTVTVAEIAARVDQLSYLSEGLNGPNTFSVESAAYGYIERHKRLVVPEDVRQWIKDNKTSWEQNDEPAQTSIVSLYSIMYWNFARLLNGGYTRDNALFVAAFRTRLIYTGYLYASKDERCVTIDEVDFSTVNRCHHAAAMDTIKAYQDAHNAATTDEAKIQAYVQHGNSEKFKRFINLATTAENGEMMKFLALASNQYAAATYLVFRQHGHHYTPELDKKYNILWKATTLAQSPRSPGNEVIHRDAVHSFGMRALHDKFFYFLGQNKLAETFVDRADVAPAGTAMIATCYAAVNLMRSLPIWRDIYAQYKDQIDKLEAQAKSLKNAKDAMQYHKNARLFGYTRVQLNTDIAQSLSPIAVGFIQSLGDEADLSHQKTLNKRAQQNPLMTNLTYGVIRTVMLRISKSGEMSYAMGTNHAAKTKKGKQAAQITSAEEEVEEEIEEMAE